jgi:hypothetical protein
MRRLGDFSCGIPSRSSQPDRGTASCILCDPDVELSDAEFEELWPGSEGCSTILGVHGMPLT